MRTKQKQETSDCNSDLFCVVQLCVICMDLSGCMDTRSITD